jgi:hypothetical protein
MVLILDAGALGRRNARSAAPSNLINADETWVRPLVDPEQIGGFGLLPSTATGRDWSANENAGPKSRVLNIWNLL